MRDGPGSGRRMLVGGFLVSMAVHVGVWMGFAAMPLSARPASTRVEMRVVRRLPESSGTPAPVPTPTPEVKSRAPLARRRAVVPRRAELPPPNSSSHADEPPPRVVAGLTAESFAESGVAGQPAFGAGNTVMAEPSGQPVVPEAVRSYSAPVDSGEVSTPPQLTGRPDPSAVFGADYPAEAKAMGIEGLTRVKLLIDEHGRVQEARAIKGPQALRRPAEQLALRLTYRPATLNGRPVAVWWVEEIPFRILAGS